MLYLGTKAMHRIKFNENFDVSKSNYFHLILIRLIK